MVAILFVGQMTRSKNVLGVGRNITMVELSLRSARCEKRSRKVRLLLSGCFISGDFVVSSFILADSR